MNQHSHRSLANAVVAGLAVICAVDLWSIVANLHRASLVSGFVSNPASISLSAAHHADDQVSISSVVYLLALAVVGVLFLIWLYELVSDLHRQRPGAPRYSPAWAVGGWFVPILNLIRPKQVMDDVWRTSTPLRRPPSQPPSLMDFWWAGWILEGLVFWIGFLISGHSMGSLADHDRVFAVGHGVDIVVAAMAMLLVRALTGRVEQVATADPRGLRLTGQFNPPPGWPSPPAGWTPPQGWLPDPTWPPAPANWQFWRPAPAWQPEHVAWQAASLNWQYWTT